MIKYYLLFISVFGSSFSTKTYSSSLSPQRSEKLFIFFINPEDCVSCLVNTYNLAIFVTKGNIPKKNIILVLRKKRKIVCENFEKDLKKILDSDKLTVLWNTELADQLKQSISKQGESSYLFIYDKALNKYVFKDYTKVISPDKISPYMN